jgi:hypothetical protein
LKKVIKIFHSFKEQEDADIKYYRNLDPDKKVEHLEIMRENYFKLKYGKIPRFQRVYKITKRKKG